MKKFRKVVALCSLCSIVFLSSAASVSAADDWAGFQDVTIGLDFSTLGRADFYTTVIPSVGSYYSKITMKLQRYSGGSWHTLASGLMVIPEPICSAVHITSPKATLTVFTALLRFTNPKAALKSTATPSPIKAAINKS